jgi:hypothetical protein
MTVLVRVKAAQGSAMQIAYGNAAQNLKSADHNF